MGSLVFMGLGLVVCQSDKGKPVDSKGLAVNFESSTLLDANNLHSFNDADIEASNTAETWSIDALTSVVLERHPALASTRSAQAVSEASARSATQRAPFEAISHSIS